MVEFDQVLGSNEEPIFINPDHVSTLSANEENSHTRITLISGIVLYVVGRLGDVNGKLERYADAR